MSVLLTLQHVFPPPRYISFSSVGVDISDTSLKYIQLERKHSHDVDLTLKYWGDIDIPEGSLERGNVKDPKRLVEVLTEVRKRCNAEYVRISLPEERAYLFETVIKRGVTAREVREQLEFKLEENVPLSPRDAYFDYNIVGRDKETGDFKTAVAVYSKETIDVYYEACRSAKVIPLSFEIEAEAIARASVPQDHPGTYMIVDFGKTRTGVGIVHKGTLMYTSTIEVSGYALSMALRKELGDQTEAELTAIKNTKGLRNTPDNAKAYKVFKSTIGALAEELEVRIHYWNTRDNNKAEREINRVVLCGGSSNLLGLPEELTQLLCVETERAHVWQNAFSLESFIPPITERYSFGYATAIGLALSDFM